MIKRAPRPAAGFLIIRNDVVRDSRLSYRARGLLAAMLSHPDNWQFNREWLAGQSASEGVSAIRTALKELEHVGYLVRRRINLPAEDGRKAGRFGWEYVLYDTPQTADEQVSSIGRLATDGLSTDGKPSDENQPSKEEPSRTTEEEDVPDLSCTDSVRFAHSVGDAEDDQESSPHEPDEPADMAVHASWREQDREAFRAVAGDRLRTDPHSWSREGEFPADIIYNAIRKDRSGKKPVKWPGRLLQNIYATGGDTGVDDWLMDRGLERAA